MRKQKQSFWPSNLYNFDIGWVRENAILIDREEDKENSLSASTVWEVNRTTTVDEKICSRTKLENVPDFIRRNLFNYFVIVYVIL